MDVKKSKRTFERLVTKKLKECQEDFLMDFDEECEKEEGMAVFLSENADFDNAIPCASGKNEHAVVTFTVDSSESEETRECDSTSESELVERYSSSYSISDEESFRILDMNASSIIDIDWRTKTENSLAQKVACIAMKHRLTHSATNDFLGLLRELGHDIKKDARTILGTTRHHCNENFEHFGLIHGIIKKIRKGVEIGTHQLHLIINIDGIPLYRSSRTNFWPILGRIANCKDSSPFVISVYCGLSKPPDLQFYLAPFLEEMKSLEKRSLTVDKNSFHIILKSVVCDAPARSFVKMCIGHGGMYGCERCVQRGVKNHGSMTFPATTSDLRTNASFRQKRNKQHHSGTSPFTELESNNMIHGNFLIFISIFFMLPKCFGIQL
jgi:hypothetical protein